VKTNISATLWARFLNNPIVWLPDNNIWAASNLQRGEYYGAHFTAVISGVAGLCAWEWHNAAELCRANMVKNDIRFNALFVPRFSGASVLKLHHSQWFLNIGCNWQSIRYTSTDNLSILPGYGLLSLQTGRNILYRQLIMAFSAGADNILNQSYEVMPGRPMPLRSVWFKINIHINKTN
jgi:hypothetical protein